MRRVHQRCQIVRSTPQQPWPGLRSIGLVRVRSSRIVVVLLLVLVIVLVLVLVLVVLLLVLVLVLVGCC